MKECEGCIYNETPKTAEELVNFLDNCCNCKRGVKEQFVNIFEDLYKSK